MPFKVVILRNVGTEDQAIEQILPKEYNYEQEAYNICIAIESSPDFEYGRLSADPFEIEKINKMVKLEIDKLAARLEQEKPGFLRNCSPHEYIHGTICETGAGTYTLEATIKAIAQITQKIELN